MATSSKINLGIENLGIYRGIVKTQDPEAAKKVSELLQENHEKHHIFFNASGFHNHIVHHLLTLYGLGAPASVIEKQYKLNASYQRPPVPVDERIVIDLSNPDHFDDYLGKEKYYHDYLVFFQQEMDKKGWDKVLKEYVFASNARADDMMGRLFAGFLHPLIHLGFGIEFHQPAIIAEAMAQAAVHNNWLNKYFYDVEKVAQPTNKTLPELLDEIRADKKLSTAAQWDDGNKIRDGILARAPDEMLKYASQWTVDEAEVEAKTVEMINNAVYFTAAAQNPPKQVKMDFYYMHSVNSSIFFSVFNSEFSLSNAQKARLLEWKGWLDLAMYASRRSPQLLLEEISEYVPKHRDSDDTKWEGIFRRLFEIEDDGHAVKLGRAVAHGEQACKKYEGENWAKIKDFMWLKVGNMVIDSVEDTGERWARSVGFTEAWSNYQDRPKNNL